MPCHALCECSPHRATARDHARSRGVSRGVTRRVRVLRVRPVAAALLDGTDDPAVAAAADDDLAGTVDADALDDGWEAYDDVDGRLYYWNDETGESRWTPPTGQLDACLAYVRDRVGVPRDMGEPAAMWLRATLNWAIDVARSPDKV
jgi:glutathione S-transferase